MRHTFYTLLSFLFSSFPLCAHAQQSLADTTAEAVALFAPRHTGATAARLVSGTEYLDYTPSNTIGNQFFLNNTAQPGSVYYDERYFTDVPLLYDLKLDQLILADTVHNVKLRLINERVAFFQLDGRHFVRVQADSAAEAPNGFYQVLLDGHVRLLARRSKKVAEEIVQQHLSFIYKETSRLFTQQNGKLTEITKLGSLLTVLADHKPELQKFVRSNKLKFSGSERELSATRLVDYYNTL